MFLFPEDRLFASIILFSWNSHLERRVCVNMIFCPPVYFVAAPLPCAREVSMFEQGHDPSTSTPVRGPAALSSGKNTHKRFQSQRTKTSLCAAGGGKTVGDETSVSTAIIFYYSIGISRKHTVQ